MRASLLGMLDAAARQRGLGYTVACCADFYCPGAATSVLSSFILDRIGDGEAPTWLFDARQPHSLSNAAAREALEMAYPNTRPYPFDSTRFERTFGIGPTPDEDVIPSPVRVKTPRRPREKDPG